MEQQNIINQFKELINKSLSEFDYNTNNEIIDILENEIKFAKQQNLQRNVTNKNIESFIVKLLKLDADDLYHFGGSLEISIYNKLIDSFKCIEFNKEDNKYLTSIYCYKFLDAIFMIGNVYIKIQCVPSDYDNMLNLQHVYFLDLNEQDKQCHLFDIIEKIKDFVDYKFNVNYVLEKLIKKVTYILISHIRLNFNDMSNFGEFD